MSIGTRTLGAVPDEAYALLGDVGGTNIRLTIARVPREGKTVFGEAQIYRAADFPKLEDAIVQFLKSCDTHRKPSAIVLGVAGPVAAGAVHFTNINWTVSEQGLRALGFRGAKLLNDFEAIALAVPRLGPELLEHIGGPEQGLHGASIAVLGAGTGFGVSGGYCEGPLARPLISEGGHVAFAPCDETEIEILRHLTARFGHVSIERILSGPGLLNLYEALCALAAEGTHTVFPGSHALIDAARQGHDLALRTVERFVAIYGGVAGDFALSFGARGGVYLAGGATRALRDFLRAPDFRIRFENKGRFSAYLTAIPTKIILEDTAAYHGLACVAHRLLHDQGNAR